MTLKNGGIEESTTKEIEAINIRETIATNIVTYRKKLKLSRNEFAKKISVSEAAISQYERGIRIPHAEILYKMADVLKVSVDTLLGRVTNDYDAIMNYRFECAAEFVFGFGLFIFETPNGSVKICYQDKDSHNNLFSSKDGVVTVKKNSNNILSLIEFSDRESFVSFVEQFCSSVLESSSAITEAFKDRIYCTASGEKSSRELVMFFHAQLDDAGDNADIL